MEAMEAVEAPTEDHEEVALEEETREEAPAPLHKPKEL